MIMIAHDIRNYAKFKEFQQIAFFNESKNLPICFFCFIMLLNDINNEKRFREQA